MSNQSRRVFLRRTAAAGAGAALGVAGTNSYRRLRAADSPASAYWTPAEPPNRPVGEPQGIFPGRVAWIHDPDVAVWGGDTSSGGWYENKFTDPVGAARMLSQSLRRLSGAETDAEAWDAVFRHHNRMRGRGDVGYQAGEVVAVKLNMNCAKRQAEPSQGLFNTPQLTLGLVRQLVQQAGVRQADILLFDGSRWISDAIFDPVHTEFPAVRFEDREASDGRMKIQPDKNAALHFADPDTPHNGETYLPTCATQATYMINAAVMKGHALAGVTLCAKNHFGSVYRENTGPRDPHLGWNPSHLHESIIVRTRQMGTYNSLVDLMGHKDLGGKTVLYLIDALYAAPHQNQAPLRWHSSPFNGHWTASVFASLDGVAIESVAVDFFAAEREGARLVGAVDNYLHEAAAAHQPPSNSCYDPAGDGTRLTSLGVHEHWNNPEQKQYSRNLGSGAGIELV